RKRRSPHGSPAEGADHLRRARDRRPQAGIGVTRRRRARHPRARWHHLLRRQDAHPGGVAFPGGPGPPRRDFPAAGGAAPAYGVVAVVTPYPDWPPGQRYPDDAALMERTIAASMLRQHGIAFAADCLRAEAVAVLHHHHGIIYNP